MPLPPLTDPLAVIDAIAEFDDIGRDDFLAKYGFGKALSYFVQYEGRFYDSKALASAAFTHQSDGEWGNQFSGGEGIARLFNSLGFRITRPGDWHYRIGEKTQRAEIAAVYGGATQGGIQPSATTPNVMVFTDQSAGETHGYNFDGWDPDDPRIFHYTGAGQIGDHSEDGQGNKSILGHREHERTLRLFESEQQDGRPGGKLQTYLGAFSVDESSPYRIARAPDRNGDMRNVFVFKLWADESAPNAGDPVAERPPEDHERVRAEFVDSERNDIREYETPPTSGKKARRAESDLVERFETHLKLLAHEVGRIRFRLSRGQGQLVTDTFDRTENTLYEAKSNINRNTIRLALGQILDYRRLLEAPVSCRILLPEPPIADLVSLLHDYDVGAIWPDGNEWIAHDPV